MTIRFAKFAAGLLATALLASGAAAQPAAQTGSAAALPASIQTDISQNLANTPVSVPLADAGRVSVDTAAADEQGAFSQADAASDELLDKATAREDISLAAQSQQTSNVSGNSVNGTSTTGTISFSDNAFQTASGLTVINANSGNNVSMNASMNVNIVMVPAPPQ
jgi:hypothetical protein